MGIECRLNRGALLTQEVVLLCSAAFEVIAEFRYHLGNEVSCINNVLEILTHDLCAQHHITFRLPQPRSLCTVNYAPVFDGAPYGSICLD